MKTLPNATIRLHLKLQGATGGLIRLDRMNAIEANLDIVMNGNNERRMHTAMEIGIVNEGERRKRVEEGPNHEGSYQVEEA